METKHQRSKCELVRVSEIKFIPDNSGMKNDSEHEIQDSGREFPVYSGEYRNPELIGNILLRDFPEFCGEDLWKFLKMRSR